MKNLRGKYKNALCVILTLTLIFAQLPSAYAEARPVIYAARQSVLAGETVEYTVSLSGNPGIAAFLIELSFDKGLFSLESSGNEALYCVSGNVTSTGTIVCTETDIGCKVLWYNTANVYVDGVLFAIRLRVSENVQSGDYSIRVNYSKSNTVNVEEQKLNLDCEDGLITVREFEPKIVGQVATCDSDEVDYSVYIQDNPGMAGIMIELAYDCDAFEPVKNAGELTILRGDVLGSGNLVGNSQKGLIRILWSNAINTNTDGSLFTIKFKRLEGTPTDLYPVEVRYDKANTMNQEGELIDFSCTDGAIRAVKYSNSSLIIYKTGSDIQGVPTQEKFFGQALTLSNNIPEKTGFHFLGWSTLQNATEIEYAPQSQYLIDKDLILFPVWIEVHDEISQIYAADGKINVQLTCSGNSTLVVATYNEFGQMIETAQKNIEDAYFETLVFDLESVACSSIAKAFLLDPIEFTPLCEQMVLEM